MDNARLKMGLSGLSVDATMTRCRKITSDIGSHLGTFNTPNPPLLTVNTAIDDLELLQQNMRTTGGTDNTILRDLALRVLLGHMRMLASYVSSVAMGRAYIILQSGFGIYNVSEPIGLLEYPTDLEVSCEKLNLGELSARWGAVTNNTGYAIGIALVTNGVLGAWHTDKPKKRSHLFKGLESGALYAIRVATMSPEGIGTWSPPIYYRPQ